MFCRALRWVPGPATLFQGVTRLQPGHSILYRNGELRITKYWELPLHAEPDASLCEQEQVERFAQKFEEAVLGAFEAGVGDGFDGFQHVSQG